MFNKDFFKGKKVLVTGHTGFKGTWLSLMLEEMGALVYGFALEHSEETPFFKYSEPKIQESCMGYIQNKDLIINFMLKIKPEIIIHLASHSTLDKGNEITDYIFNSNVMGVVNLLEGVRKTDSVKSVLVVTSDKCYKNFESDKGYVETSELGAQDPYSTSKACQELITECYRKSFFGRKKLNIPVATARASNVIGGGDYNLTRLFPYLISCFLNNQNAEIRNKNSVRPWQNVLDVLGGYLSLSEKLYNSNDGDSEYASAFNFGPDSDGFVTVGEAADTLKKYFKNAQYSVTGKENTVLETKILKLDSTKSHDVLGWKQQYSFDDTLKMAAEFAKRSVDENIRNIAFDNIRDYMKGI